MMVDASRLQTVTYSSDLYLLFFQAEDGIRDTSVTGVQTCALPIWLSRGLIHLHFTGTPSRLDGIGLDIVARESLQRHEIGFPSTSSGEDPALDGGGEHTRSEERRVGKACETRRSR